MDIKDIVSRYKNGETIRAIAKSYACRTCTVRKALASEGINASLLRGMRIGISQKGVPKSGAVLIPIRIKRDITEPTWAYIAGIFDGEGCLTTSNGRTYRIDITQNGTELHAWLQKTLGVGVYSSTYGHCFHFRISAQAQVHDFLVGVVDYCIVKREKVESALMALNDKYGWATHQPIATT